MSLIVYQTDLDGYFIGPVEADPDPLNPGGHLIPAGCIGSAPPQMAANEAARWQSGAWVKVPDHRGRVYWLADGSRHEITQRGVAPPAGALDQAPALPPAIPAKVTMRQARLALLAAGLLPQVDAAVAAIPGAAGDAARIEWEYALTVERDSPLVASLAAALSLTPTQLDALFAQAAAL